MSDLLAVLDRVLAPPADPVPFAQWVRQLRLPLDGGPAAGEPYDPDGHPAHQAFLAAFAEARWHRFVVIGPTQDGKTWATQIVPTLYCLAQLRAPVVLALPSLTLWNRLWQGKWSPAFAACDLLPSDGLGSDGGTPSTLLTPAGARFYCLGGGTRNEGALAAVTGRFVFVDEADDFNPARRIDLAFARADAWMGAARRALTSTIKGDTAAASRVLREHAQGTAYRLVYPCPHCGGWQTWDWSRVTYDAASDLAAQDSARLACTHCAVALTDAERRTSLAQARLLARGQACARDGAITGDLPATTTWSLRWTALDSPLKSLGDLAVRHRQACHQRDAEGEHGPLRQFHRDQLAEGYRGDRQDDADHAAGPLEPSHLAARSQAHGWADVLADTDEAGTWSRYWADIPPDATAAVLPVDVQLDRIYWSLIAGGERARTWDVAWGYECWSKPPQPLAPGQLSELLDRLERAVAARLGRLPLIARVVDTGYQEHGKAVGGVGHEAELVAYLAARRGRWAGVRGVGQLPKGAAGIITWDPAWRPGLGRWVVDTDRARALVHAGYRTAPDAPGAALLPRGLASSNHYLRHQCAHVEVTDPTTHRTAWKRRSGREDWLDVRCYGTALLRHRLTAPAPARRQVGVVGSIGE